MKGENFPRPREIHHMTPLLERQPAAGSGTHSAPRTPGDAQLTPPPTPGDAQPTPPPTPGVMDKAVKAAPAARSRRRPGGDDGAAEGAFVCRTCSRRFPSFQALGGHRTGHTRLQARHALPRQQKPARAAHECAVCGLEFAMGQALGGHMRRHKQEQQAEAQAQVRVEVEVEQPNEEEALDSSCPPTLEEHRGGEYLPPLEEHRGGEYEGCSSGPASASEPRLLNLLV